MDSIQTASVLLGPRPPQVSNWRTWFMFIVGAPYNEKFRQLTPGERRDLHIYFWWLKWNSALLIYHQHSYVYFYCRNPKLMAPYVRMAGPLMHLFGGPEIINNPRSVKWAAFCSVFATIRGLFWILPAVGFARWTIARLPFDAQDRVCDYLRDAEPFPFFSVFTLPGSWYNLAVKEQSHRLYNYYLTTGRRIPKSIMRAEEERLASETGVKRKLDPDFKPRLNMRLHASDEKTQNSSTK